MEEIRDNAHAIMVLAEQILKTEEHEEVLNEVLD